MRTTSRIVLFLAAISVVPLASGQYTSARAEISPIVAAGEWTDLEGLLPPLFFIVGCCEAQSADAISTQAGVQRIIDAYRANGVVQGASFLQKTSAAVAISSAMLWLDLHPGQLPEPLASEFRKTLMSIRAAM